MHNSVFPRHRTLFKKARVKLQLLGFIFLHHVTIALLYIFWGFHSIIFSVFIEITNNWLF